MDSDKRLAFETLFERGRVRVLFHINVQGVELPAVARAKSTDGVMLALDYSKGFAMPSFKVGDDGVRAVLTFGGRSHMTFVPWAAVVALLQGGELMETWPTPGVDGGPTVNDFGLDEGDMDKWLSKAAEG